MNRLAEIFEDEVATQKIKKLLPYLFQMAELEASRAGKVGMEVGTLREQILIALLIYKFGEENVDAKIPVTAREVDVKVFGQPVSIRTITGASGIKLAWTVDAQKAKTFRENYKPSCDILLVQIAWGGVGGIYHIPLEVQKRVFERSGREKYIKLPKPGTNPRGVELSKEALGMLMTDKNTKYIEIVWQKSEINYTPTSDGLNTGKEALAKGWQPCLR